MTPSEQYNMLLPKYKYTRAFCTEEEIDIADGIRQFVDREIMPRRHDLEGGWHRDEKLALDTLWKLYAELVKLGTARLNMPKKFGGLGLSGICAQMIGEELGRGDYALATLPAKITWVVGTMNLAGREDLLEEFAPRIVTDEPWTACMAITEPAGGANIEDPAMEFKTIRTTARLEGEEWVINGHKIWPGPAGPADHFKTRHLKGMIGYWTVATTDPAQGAGGVGLFIVPGDAEGLSFSKPYQKMGQCWGDENTDIWFDNVRIPKRYRVDARPGEGARIIKGAVIGWGRLGTGAKLTGQAQAVLEIVLEHTGKREIAGKPVRERSLFAAIIAEMLKMTELARQYRLSVAWQAAHPEIYGPPWSPEMIARFSLARLYAGEAIEFCANKGMELMGAYGYAYDYHVEKYMRDFKIAKLWLGGPQRDTLDIAQGLYGPFKWAGYEGWLKSGAEVKV
ncbi:MAG: acyl-CoA/acyl-ACP dehydrogenase [Chloroflexi bacterium]|nr:acyl-CoA/acyl-ACP dehydrogenase [Chloroflexota bacterium]